MVVALLAGACLKSRVKHAAWTQVTSVTSRQTLVRAADAVQHVSCLKYNTRYHAVQKANDPDCESSESGVLCCFT